MTATRTQFTAFDDRACILGEGPFWHPERGQFFWFDIVNNRLLSRDAGGPKQWDFDRMASAAGWIDSDRLLIGTETGLAVLDLDSGALTKLAEIEADDTGTRSNDGRADRQGGFWLGTMGKNGEENRGAIWRWYRGELRRLVDVISIPNAICFSPDGRTAHYSDTPRGLVWRQSLDAQGWPEGERELYLDLSEEGLRPDGAVIDSEGAFCVACWGASRVIRFGVDGSRLEEYEVGGQNASCPAFGGADLRDMLVTTALQKLENPDGAEGLPYLVRADVPGLPEPRVQL